jgi:group II intron reverse transcriptase/maturase
MIPKPDVGERPLGIPTIKDRVVQTAAKLILEPIFEADFQEFSYGFREGKSCHQALQAVWKWMNFGHTEVIDADIQGFFDNIPHDKLLRTVASRVSDGKMLRLIKQFLKAPIWDEGRLHKSKKGTPQGGVISPLLANIYLNHLDQFWVRKGYDKYAKLVRYADDFVLLCKGNAEFYLGEVKRLLTNLGLELSGKKTRIVTSTQQGFDFLGFTLRRVWAFRPKHKDFGYVTGVGISRKVLKKARKSVNEIVGQGGRKSPVPMVTLVSGVNNWLRHWLPYYCYANRKRDFKHLYLKIVLERLVRAEVARRSGNKRRLRKWKSMNPKFWEDRYGLIDVIETYYRKRKQLYASLFEHPINAVS